MSPCFTNPASQLHSYDPTVFWHFELSGHFELSLHSSISVNSRHILKHLTTASKIMMMILPASTTVTLLRTVTKTYDDNGKNKTYNSRIMFIHNYGLGKYYAFFIHSSIHLFIHSFRPSFLQYNTIQTTVIKAYDNMIQCYMAYKQYN